METTQRIYPSIGIQVIFVFLFIIICGAISSAHDGLLSIQTLIVSPCSGISNLSSNCSDNGTLGFSNFEYELMLSVSSWCSLLAVAMSGIIIDFIGMSFCATITSSIGLFGTILRAASATMQNHHNLTIVGVIIGQALFTASLRSYVAIRNYTAIWYFDNRYQTVIVGIFNSSVKLAMIFIYFFFPQFAFRVGVPAALWLLALIMSFSVIACLFICTLTKFSENLRYVTSKNLESLSGKDTVSLLRGKSLKNILKSYRVGFWLILISIALVRGTQKAIYDNCMKIMVVLFRQSIGHTISGIGMAYMIGFFAAFPCFYLIGCFELNYLFGIVSILSILITCILFCVPHIYPFENFSIFNVANSVAEAALIPLIGKYVPHDYLGIAMSLVFISGDALSGMITFIMGLFLQLGAQLGPLQSRWRISMIFNAALIIISTFCVCVLVALEAKPWIAKIVRRWRQRIGSTENEKESLISKQNFELVNRG